MTAPWTTIIIPTHKRPHLLRKAIESALSQTQKNIIVLVLDNASGDETADLVKKFSLVDSRVRYICHQCNIGMLQNYQYGINAVTTDYFSFLSDDDLLLPSFCETAFEGFSQHPEIAFFASSTIHWSKEQGIIGIPLDHWPREGIYLPYEGLVEMIGKYPVPTTITFKREKFSSISIDHTNLMRWDCDLLIQLAGQFSFAISKKPCGLFFHHPGSLTHLLDSKKTCASIARMIERVESFGFIEKDIRKKTMDLLEDEYRKNLFSYMLNTTRNTYSFLILISLIPGIRSIVKIAKKLHNRLKRKKCAVILKKIPVPPEMGSIK